MSRRSAVICPGGGERGSGSQSDVSARPPRGEGLRLDSFAIPEHPWDIGTREPPILMALSQCGFDAQTHMQAHPESRFSPGILCAGAGGLQMHGGSVRQPRSMRNSQEDG